jgi:hypothetical protein
MADLPRANDLHAREPVLFVVHPGSACGSADANLGAEDAAVCRGALASDIAAWRGSVVVIDSVLSSELRRPRYANLCRAIETALSRAKIAGFVSTRVTGDDAMGAGGNQSQAAAKVVRRHSILPGTHRIELTGCWHHPNGLYGCVNDVRQTLAGSGFHTAVRDSAINEPKSDNLPPDQLARSDALQQQQACNAG